DLRLLYVALTRARHACWLGLADLKHGQSKASVLHQGALAWLLAGGEPLPEPAALGNWLQRWQAGGIAIGAAPEVTEVVWQPRAEALSELRARTPDHRPFEHWWISSYSALAVGGDA